MRKIRLFLSMLTLVLLVFTPMSVSADIGPKPSVEIKFIGLEKEEYYVTLLSENESTGPWSHGDEYHDYMGDEAIFDKFAEYEDADGYYFLSYMEDCSEDDIFEWNYYPPHKFKILVYLPQHDRFIMNGEICERYAFDSYFTVRITDRAVEIEQSENGIVNEEETSITDKEVINDNEKSVVLEIEESYDFTMEIVSLIARIILTILVEIMLAWVFAYREKKVLTTIVLANVVTQVILNILLNVINYSSGHYAFVFHYIWMEIVVFVMEAIIYDKLIGREDKTTGKKYHPWAYAAVANVISIIVGIWIARVIPGIF